MFDLVIAIARSCIRAGTRRRFITVERTRPRRRAASRVIGSGTLDSLPHNGAVVTLLAVCGSTHKESDTDIFMVGILGSVVALVVVIGFGSVVGSF